VDPFWDRPYRLASRPQRPGELTVVVPVALSEGARRHVFAAASADRLPPALWIAIAIEAQRCLMRAAELASHPADALAEMLDDIARSTPLSVASSDTHPALMQLQVYARALLAGDGTVRVMLGESVPLSPAMHVGASWAAEAEAAGMTIEKWASTAANACLPGRTEWEAASAAQGQTLAEWTTIQAARRWRTASTSANSRA
jgi:hypothetical protein